MNKLINNLTRTQKKLIIFFGDLVLNLLATAIALILRLEKLDVNFSDFKLSFALAFIVFIATFYFFKIYRNIFRFFNFELIKFFLYTAIVSIILFYSLIEVIRIEGAPRSIAILQPIIFFILVCIFRTFVSYTILFLNKENLRNKINILIYGAGYGGNEFLNYINQKNNYKVFGFIDDNTKKTGSYLNGIKIFNIQNIESLISKNNIKKVFISIPSLDKEKRKKIINNLLKFDIEILSLPILDNFDKLNFDLDNFAKINFEDLFGRNINLNFNSKIVISNKTIIVTGAGGSIGSELAIQIINLKPKKIILLDNSEYNIYNLQKNIQQLSITNNVEIIYLLTSILDKNQLSFYFKKYNPDYLFHTAAYKHVNILETSVIQAINTNVFGTLNLLNVAQVIGLEKFVFVSTDKAVKPSSVMGMTKRLSEIIIQSYAKKFKDKTSYSIVRFGNVVGSSGSVIPLFLKQIKNKEPITITDPNVERYFMSISEAASLIIETLNLEDNGSIYVLEMGERIKILDLAKKLINISGNSLKSKSNPNGEIEIKYIGLQPGEKIYEELYSGELIKTENKNIYLCREKLFSYEEVMQILKELDINLKLYNSDKLNNLLNQIKYN